MYLVAHMVHTQIIKEKYTHTYIETANPTVFPLQSHCPHRILWDCGGWTLVPLGQQFSIHDSMPWLQFEANVYVPFKVEVCETWI